MNLCELDDRQSNRNRPDRDAGAGCSGIGPLGWTRTQPILDKVVFTSAN